MSHHKSNTEIRKKPTQPRSAFTVDAILEATVRILTEQGLEKLNTNAVAELAGVSIGSIYQYFPSKDALIAELRRRHRKEVNEVLSELAHTTSNLNFEDSLRLTVRAVVEIHSLAPPGLHFLLTQQHGDLGFVSDDQPRFSAVDSSSNPTARYLRSMGLSKTRVKVMTRVCYEIVEALIHASVIHAELDLENDLLVDEIVCAVLGYLQRAGVPIDMP